jgi:cell fate regulator YaaT (PSP1 superfamily)
MTEETLVKTIKLAGVRFRENWKVYDFDATDMELTVGDRVIVDSEKGPGMASVVRIRRAAPPAAAEHAAPVRIEDVPDGVEIDIDGEEPKAAQGREGGPKTIRRVLRKASAEDLAKEARNREREDEAFSTAQDMITERDLAMKLIRVEYSFDASRVTFFFFSENRIDFRDLVKDLAFKLKSRIEMRQVGVRDVARMIGGFGPCGRELCCSSFLRNFEPVSIRMAKKQEMVLNPAKISGVCGRLLCCLSYEYEMYDANKRDQADLRQTAVKEKKDEEDRRLAEERKEAESQRLAEDKKRQEERRQQQDQRRDKKKDGGQKDGARQEKKKEQADRKGQQERKGAQPQGEQRQRQPQPRPEKQHQRPEKQQQQPRPEKQQQPRPEKQQQPVADKQTPLQQQPAAAQVQQGQQPASDGDKAAKKKRRRFWRKKKKGQGGEGQAPQGGGQPAS